MGDRDAAGGLGRDQVARALRESRATRFFAVVEGEAREVKAAKTRGRWERLADAATALGASRIEARDDDGATLAVVQLLDPDDAPEPEREPERERASDRRDSVAEVERLLVVVLRAQDHALQRHAEQTRAIVDASVQVMTASAERAASLERAVLGLITQRERDLEAAHESLAAEARAQARAAARAKPDESEEDAQASKDFDAMGRKLIEDHVMPVVGAKIAAKLAGGGATS